MRILLFLSLLIGPLVPGVLPAQVVQLPEFHQFSSGSSFLIPDRGSMYGGGVMRRSESSRSVRTPFLPSGRSVNISQGTTSTSATVTIHEPPPWARSDAPEPSRSGDQDSLRMIGAADLNQAAPGSLASIRKQLSAEDAAANQKAIKYADMAEDCLKQGKTSIAKLFLRSAITTARGEYQSELKLRLTQISETSTAQR